MDTIKICFGKRIKEVRKAKHITQEQLAEIIDINLRQMARIEAGESFFTAETLGRLCSALDITPEVLFAFPFGISSKSEAFTDFLSKLELISSDENKVEFMAIALDALNNRNSLERLKILIKGLELNL